MPATQTPAAAAIEAVADRMEAIAAPLHPDDGVRRFNELYLAVTREVAKSSTTYEDAAFVARLDVIFAGLYFDAVEASRNGKKIPRAWAPLFEKRKQRGIAPLQFAIAGMNAHINHDLALALVKTTKEFGLDLDLDTAQHRDYLLVNGILNRVQDVIKARFTTGVVKAVDEAGGRADDVLASWSVARARDSAWTHAQALTALQGIPLLRDQFLVTLARNVGFASRALLLPTG